MLFIALPYSHIFSFLYYLSLSLLFSVLDLSFTSCSSHAYFISLFFIYLFVLRFLPFFDFNFFPLISIFSFLPFFPLIFRFLLFFPSCFCFLFPLDMVFSLTIFLCVSFLAFCISTLLYISIHNCDNFAVTGSKAKFLGVVVIGLSGKRHFYCWRY